MPHFGNPSKPLEPLAAGVGCRRGLGTSSGSPWFSGMLCRSAGAGLRLCGGHRGDGSFGLGMSRAGYWGGPGKLGPGGWGRRFKGGVIGGGMLSWAILFQIRGYKLRLG